MEDKSLAVKVNNTWYWLGIFNSYSAADQVRQEFFNKNRKKMIKERLWEEEDKVFDVLYVNNHPYGEVVYFEDKSGTKIHPDISENFEIPKKPEKDDPQSDIHAERDLSLLVKLDRKWYFIENFPNFEDAYWFANTLWNWNDLPKLNEKVIGHIGQKRRIDSFDVANVVSSANPEGVIYSPTRINVQVGGRTHPLVLDSLQYPADINLKNPSEAEKKRLYEIELSESFFETDLPRTIGYKLEHYFALLSKEFLAGEFIK